MAFQLFHHHGSRNGALHSPQPNQSISQSSLDATAPPNLVFTHTVLSSSANNNTHHQSNSKNAPPPPYGPSDDNEPTTTTTDIEAQERTHLLAFPSEAQDSTSTNMVVIDRASLRKLENDIETLQNEVANLKGQMDMDALGVDAAGAGAWQAKRRHRGDCKGCGVIAILIIAALCFTIIVCTAIIFNSRRR